MKKIIFPLLMACSMVCNAQVVFDSTYFDFGTIHEGDGPVSTVFRFRNISSDTVFIQSIATSCGCTTTQHNNAGIAPGAKDSVRVNFDPSGLSLDVYRYIYVCFRNIDDCQELMICANIEPSPLTMRQIYPIRLSDSIGVTNRQIDWNYITYGTQSSKTVIIANISNTLSRIDLSAANPEIDIDAPAAIKGNQVEPVVITYNIPTTTQRIGPRHDTVNVLIDGIQARPLVIDAHVTDNVSMEGDYASIHCSQTDFNVSSWKKKVRMPITITNVGNAPLVIHHIENDVHSQLELEEGQIIYPGHLVQTNVRVVRSARSDRKQGYEFIHLYTNAPMRLVYQLRVVW